jgi:membrane-associated protein
VEYVLELIQSNVQHAPFLIFGLLMLAGFNIPIPEDGMLFISGVLASHYPQHLAALFTAVYLGAYFSDLICYWLGRLVGPKLLEIRFFSNMVTPERREKIHAYYEKYGIVTLIFGRFIPFGVRNGLFLTAGLGKMTFVKFALSDLLACTISTVTFFSLYYHFGPTVVAYVRDANILIFGVAGVALGVYLVTLRKRKNIRAGAVKPNQE